MSWDDTYISQCLDILLKLLLLILFHYEFTVLKKLTLHNITRDERMRDKRDNRISLFAPQLKTLCLVDSVLADPLHKPALNVPSLKILYINCNSISNSQLAYSNEGIPFRKLEKVIIYINT